MKNIPVHSVEIKDINNEFSFKTEKEQVRKKCTTWVTKPKLPRNTKWLSTFVRYNIKWLWYKKVLGISDYTKIKKPEKARTGLPGKPIAELTKLGRYIVPAGKENDIRNILFSQTSIHDYQKLCSLDCLGVSEEQHKPDDYVYKKFRKQLGRGLGRTMKPI